MTLSLRMSIRTAPPPTEGVLFWLLVVCSFHFMAQYSLFYSITCWDGSYGSLLCGIAEFVEAVWLSIGMSVVGGSNSWVAGWWPHFLVSMYFIWHLILVWGIIWFEYFVGSVLGTLVRVHVCWQCSHPRGPWTEHEVKQLYSLVVGGRQGVHFPCPWCGSLSLMLDIDNWWYKMYMFGVLMNTTHFWSCFVCVWSVVFQLVVCLQSPVYGFEYPVPYLWTYYFIFIVYVCLCVVVWYLGVSSCVLVHCRCHFFLVAL